METNNNKKYRFVIIITIILFFLFLKIIFSIVPPNDFPSGTIISIEKGESLTELSKRLESDRIIRSKFFFQVFMVIGGGEHRIVAGDYLFDKPMSSYNVARHFIGSIFNIERIHITLPEGLTRIEMADVLAKNLPHFNKENFLSLTKNDEGYLFPDTYLFFPSRDENVVIDTMKKNFEKKLTPYKDDIRKSGYSEKEIITMASIIEREAEGNSDRGIIAGILWNRIRIGKPLQVDAPFVFILGKGSSELTRADLNTNSPYNTYTHKGLPPGPISNPGIQAIKSAIHPVASDYLFYLHDKNGKVYYARTFAEHIKNKQLYLR